MSKRKFLSEFGLNMHASLVGLTQQDSLHRIPETPESPFHIYMITQRPRICLDPKSVVFSENVFEGRFTIQRGSEFEFHDFKLPYQKSSSSIFECSYPHTEYQIKNQDGKLIDYGKVALLLAELSTDFWGLLDLEVMYVGQSYGDEGSRTAIARLINHSTLQAIYADSIRLSPDKEIWLVLLSFEPLLLSSFDGTQEVETSPEEDLAHLKQVHETSVTEQQQISFTEAALIRYFQPEYNKTYKDTFPNPAHTSYKECYSLDLNTICVEFNSEPIKARLWSKNVAPLWIHIAQFPLHSPEDRKNMFEFLL